MDQHQHQNRPTPSAGGGGGGGAGIRWEPHGRTLTACLVALNVFLVLLVYVYFWRFFSRTRGGGGQDGGGDVEAASSAASSPPASPKARDRREVERAITALPVFVVRRAAPSESDAGGGADTCSPAECAICIAEFADGEEGRLLPRCGHRFHARCVDAWFRFHTTCPLCRATVLADADDANAAQPPAAPPAEPTAASQPPSRRTDTDRPSASTDAGDADSPV